MERMDGCLEKTLPKASYGYFAKVCKQSLTEAGPVAIEGSYKERHLGDVFFRCIMLPVRA
jgi:hypothetical protein